MLRSRYSWAVLLVGLALLGGAWIAVSQEPAATVMEADGLVEAPAAGYLAPAFTLTSTMGEQVALSDFRGQPVVLNFWATWCPPCRAEMPQFQQVSVRYRGQATILGIDQGEPQSLVTDFANSIGVTYPLLLDSDNAVSRQYDVNALPKTLFVDSDGVIREIYTGIINRAVLEDRIERLLAEDAAQE
ncbi:MAG: TlpA disulfide reductase family protein [Candidatus Promineifilaceae bacterium]|nr:TlpA disulfide reductase family protein [Candidatus Promineifilaceae bacterium]